MKKTEIIMVGLCLLAIALNLSLVPGGVLLTMLSLMMLGTIYFYFSFALLNNIRFRHIFKKESFKGLKTSRIVGAIGTGFALSMVLIGLMFRFMAWPGAAINLMGGVFFVSAVILISTIKYLKTKDPFYKPVLIRTVILCAVGVVFLFIKSSDIMDFKYRNYPAYREAQKQSDANPQDEDLYNKAEEERHKMEREGYEN